MMASMHEQPTGHRHNYTVKLLLYAVLFSLFFTPKSYAVGSTVYDVWKAAMAVAIACIVLIYLTRDTITVRWICLVLFAVFYYFISSSLASSDGSLGTKINYSMRVIGFVTLLEHGLADDRELCLRAFLIAGVVMCGVHYVTFLRYRYLPLGMKSSAYGNYGELSVHPWFFLTHDNGSVFYFLPVLCGLWYYVIEYKSDAFIALICSAFTLYMYWNLNTVTAKLIATAAVILAIVIWRFGAVGLLKSIGYKTTILFGLATCAIVPLAYTNDVFVRLAHYYGKSPDMGRGYIWTRAFRQIASSPLFGSGFEQDITSVFKLGINHCHNIVVQIFYTGGVMTFLLFIAWLIACESSKTREGNLRSEGEALLCVFMLATFGVSVFDWYLYMPVQFFPFVLQAYSQSPWQADSRIENERCD